MSAIRIDPGSLLPAVFHAPPSKSDAIRARVLAHALGTSWPTESSPQPEDVAITERALRQLHGDIDCGDGGAPFRFLLAQAAVTPGTQVRFFGSARLGARPHGPLLEALRAAGARIQLGRPWPIEVAGAIPSTRRFRVEGLQSSQFASSLLLAAVACARRTGAEWMLELAGPLASRGYFELTLEWVRRAGVRVFVGENLVEVGVPRSLTPTFSQGERGDWSGAAFLLLLAWRTGGVVQGLARCGHPDEHVLRVLESVGLSVDLQGIGVRGEGRAGVELSASQCPDLVPPLCALACVLPAPSRFADVEVLRFKESDRLEGLRRLLSSAGGKTELRCDTLTVWPIEKPRPFSVFPESDHRMAMTAATLAVLLGVPAVVHQPECVSKSFPTFWEELSLCGATSRCYDSARPFEEDLAF